MKIYRTFAIVVAIASMVGTILSTSANASGQTAIAQPSATVQQPLPTSSSGAVQVQTQNSPTSGSSQANQLATIYGPCTLYPQNIYERNSFYAPPYGNVGGKAYTSCTTLVSSIHQSITFEKQSWLGYWEQVGPVFTDSSGPNTDYLNQTNAGIYCTNSLNTLWTFVVTVQVLYQGTYYYATTNAFNGPQQFPCGT